MTTEKLTMKTTNMADENFRKLQELFPEAVTEIEENGKIVRAIDKDKLQQLISTSVVDGSKERYQFTWPGKRDAILLANTPTNKTLRPVKGENKTDDACFNTTENLYIEGDNLEVLKLLQEKYLGKIKMIYIDPPYNTGNDFIYKDNFAQNAEDYAIDTNQIDKNGNRFVKNLETSGRFHSDWLSMIYSRLKIARNLLSEDGIIFISIDDVEFENTCKIGREIFGNNNYICNFIRKNKAGSGHDSSKIAVEFDYILCFAKNISTNNVNKEIVNVTEDSKYRLEDDYVQKRGKYYLRDLDYKGSYSEKLDYPIKTPDGTFIYSGGKFGEPNTWRWSKEKFNWGLNNDYIVFKKTGSSWKVYIKQYQFVDNNGDLYVRTIPFRALIEFSNGQGTIDFNSIMGNDAFSYPKPVALMRYLINIASNKKDIILDFFSGSATTAHAVMQLNSEDGGNRKFIMVQLPEVCDEKSEAYKAGYNTICDIGKERIRRAGAKIKEELEKTNPERAKTLDTGFRVLRLDSSNMKDVFYRPVDLKRDNLLDYTSNVKEDRTEMDLLFQIMPELNADYTSKIEETYEDGKKIFNVESNYIVACFAEDISEKVIRKVASYKPDYAVFRDSCFSKDSDLANVEQIFRAESPETRLRIL